LARGAEECFGTDRFGVTKAKADELPWDASQGTSLSAVAFGSPAEKVGLKMGSISFGVDGIYGVDRRCDKGDPTQPALPYGWW
jgi:hypothetical protein